MKKATIDEYWVHFLFYQALSPLVGHRAVRGAVRQRQHDQPSRRRKRLGDVTTNAAHVYTPDGLLVSVQTSSQTLTVGRNSANGHLESTTIGSTVPLSDS